VRGWLNSDRDDLNADQLGVDFKRRDGERHWQRCRSV